MSQNAVPAHLAHGDSLGTCDCLSDCTELGDQVEAICLELLQDFPLGDISPEEFCAFAGDVVTTSCGGLQCEQDPGPEGCVEACQGIASAAFDACVPLVDPFVCEQGANVVFEQCLGVFECPPPPPPCDVQCLDEANAIIVECVESPPEELICEGVEGADPVAQTCFAEGQGYLNECLFGDDGCFDRGESCDLDCSAEFGEDVLDCLTEPVCQPYEACFELAGQNVDACLGGCCVDACVAAECGFCEGDPECLEQCRAEICEPACFPPPPCDQDCAEEADAFISECLAEPNPEPFCPEHPEAECLAQGYDVFAECLEAQCGIDGCPAQCVGSCVAECNDPQACEDPALNPCIEECFGGPVGCPPDLPIECPDGTCAENIEACDGPVGCPPEVPFQCEDGRCEATEAACACDPLTSVVGCDGESCLPAEALGDAVCNPELNCPEYDYDGGDCLD